MPRSRSAVSRSDLERMKRTNRRLLIVMLVTVIGTLAVVAWVLATNFPGRQTPRTFQERQLVMLETVVKQKPQSEEAWADYILALVAAKQYSKAEQVINQAEKTLGPNVIDILYVKARLSAARGDSDEALALVDKAIKAGLEFRKKELERLAEMGTFPDPKVIKGPVLASAYYFQAQLYADKRMWEEAVESLTKSLEEEPASADALVMRGNAYLEMGKAESATADFEKALKFIPGYAPAVEGLKKAEDLK
ncbi:MAG: tetratricopeptide repeat protein [Anaerosomatales bacterium]|nr:tetratricopeptide repeat protein [Coriobacteriia bacterium]MDI6692562.1 tetratricopeptide repeat protein [Anaerosomatales bacterium]MDI6843706.1 tetratricopeptide repeat protein [Anaerosomatales bacterium]